MIIANTYNHLNAREYLIVNKTAQFAEIQACLTGLDANQYLKISCDKANLGKIYYDQAKLNKAIKKQLNEDGWAENVVYYYVTGDESTTREIVNIMDKDEQKRIIDDRGFDSFSTYNQVDFQKDRIAVEVQFGKYFSVAYDLHVKHTFFYSRNDIDVGVEIIPTKAMEEHMDTGVPWFENEVTNVIREGRTNPPVPVLILGIQPDNIASKDPLDYNDADLSQILRHSAIDKFINQVQAQRASARGMNQATIDRVARIEQCLKKIHLLLISSFLPRITGSYR